MRLPTAVLTLRLLVSVTGGALAFDPHDVRLVEAEARFGVLSMHLPGLHASEPSVVHAYFKCLRGAGASPVDVQGFVSVEQAARPQYGGGPQLAEGGGSMGEDITVAFSDAEAREVARMVGDKDPDHYDFPPQPRFIRARLDEAQLQDVHYISFDSADRLAVLGGRLAASCSPRTTRKIKRLVVGVCPPYQMPRRVFQWLLETNIHWHSRVGFDRHVLYWRGDDARAFRGSPTVTKLVSRGRLEIVRWTMADSGVALPFKPRYQGQSLDNYDQAIVYNHLLLSYWGANAIIFFADLDEFFYSPLRQSPRAMLDQGGCLHRYRHHAQLQR